MMFVSVRYFKVQKRTSDPIASHPALAFGSNWLQVGFHVGLTSSVAFPLN